MGQSLKIAGLLAVGIVLVGSCGDSEVGGPPASDPKEAACDDLFNTDGPRLIPEYRDVVVDYVGVVEDVNNGETDPDFAEVDARLSDVSESLTTLADTPPEISGPIEELVDVADLFRQNADVASVAVGSRTALSAIDELEAACKP